MHQRTVKGRSVVVVGGGFAGLAAAHAARRGIAPEDTVTVVSQTGRFIFAPSLIWSALDKPVPPTSFGLEAALAACGIDFVRASVDEVRIDERVIVSERLELPYDRLIVATGGRPDAPSIPGLAGEFRAASWVVGEDSAREARAALRLLFDNPGPLVIGAAQNASYASAAYELALNLDTELRRRGLRDRTPITFVTAERHLGDLGIGQTAAHAALERLFAEREIIAYSGVGIQRVQKGKIKLSDGRVVDAAAAVIMPPFSGSVNIWKSARLTDETGFIPVTSQYRHVHFPEIYAAGIASYFQKPVLPLNGFRAPHTAYLSLWMGKVAGENAAASLGSVGANPIVDPTLPSVVDMRVLDGGDVGLVLTSAGVQTLQHSAAEVPGAAAHDLKIAMDRYLTWQLRTGKLTFPQARSE